MKTLFYLLLLPLIAHAQSIYVGSGDAMAPALENSAIVSVWPVKFDSLKTKDIAAFKYKDNIIVSRLVQKEGEKWVTKGDENKNPDPVILDKENFLGRVTNEYHCANVFIQKQLVSIEGFYTLNDVLEYSYSYHFSEHDPFFSFGGGAGWSSGGSFPSGSSGGGTRSSGGGSGDLKPKSITSNLVTPTGHHTLPNPPIESSKPLHPVPDSSVFAPFFMVITGLLYWVKRKCAI